MYSIKRMTTIAWQVEVTDACSGIGDSKILGGE